MECLLCKSSNIDVRPTVMSGFLAERVYGSDKDKMELSVNLCHCRDCEFSFFDKRLTDEEMGRLYRNYRQREYQQARQKYEVWYTEKVNNAINRSKLALNEQKRVINKLIDKNIKEELKIALDYGGNEGESFTDKTGTKEKYVYDISGVETVSGVNRIATYEQISEHKFDFIMCNMTLEHVTDPIGFIKLLYDIGCDDTYFYIEVPSHNPFAKTSSSIFPMIKMLFNPVLSNHLLIKHYLNTRNQTCIPMHEHVNFFTPKAITGFLEREGFEVIDVEENTEKGVVGESLVLSALCKKAKPRE